jgi:hypothetical protein
VRSVEQRADFRGADQCRHIRGLHHSRRIALAAAPLAAVVGYLRNLLGNLLLVPAALAGTLTDQPGGAGGKATVSIAR